MFALFIIIIVLFAVLFGVGGGLVGALPPFLTVEHPILTMVTGILVFGLPVVAIIYSIIAHFSKAKPINQPVKWTILLVWILALFLFIFSGFRLKINDNLFNFNNRKWGQTTNFNEVRGNNIPSQKTIHFDEVVTQVEIGKHINASMQIEQTQGEMSSIEIKGDENLIELVKHDLHDGKLTLSAFDRLRSSNDLVITLRTSEIKGIQMGFVGNIRMNNAFTGEKLDIKMRGVGNFHADSLYVNSLTVHTDGVGSANIAGKVGNARLETAGVGKIDAMELIADTVYAKVDGVGSIQCNPVDYLEGRSQGVGSITYKDEPKNKNVSSAGVGKIRKKN